MLLPADRIWLIDVRLVATSCNAAQYTSPAYTAAKLKYNSILIDVADELRVSCMMIGSTSKSKVGDEIEGW
jgi:hypothetical protein